MKSIERILEIDEKYTQSLRIPEGRPVLKKTAAFLAHSGDSWYWGIGLALLWFVGPESWRPQIVLLFLGIVITALSVFIVKYSVKRPRPEGEWGQIYRRSDPHAFPSGHAARVSMLTLIMLLTGYWWIGLILLVWAVLVDLSRIGLGVHYLSDILGGSLIGVVMALLAVWSFSFFY
jgi:undecaprenyl-diphosphatase